jgi:hypothetical protein
MISSEHHSTESDPVPKYTYAVLDPRIHNSEFAKQAQVANEVIFQNGNVLGIEVTDRDLAEKCQLGNIDPQHTEGNLDLAAIEVAETIELHDGDITFATIRADLDSVGSMVLLTLRKEGIRITEEIRTRLKKIADSDKFARGGWPGVRPLSTLKQNYEESAFPQDSQELSAIASAVSDSGLPLGMRVSILKEWILTGDEPVDYRKEVEKNRKELAHAIDNGEIKISTIAENKIALVESKHRAGTSVGYTQAPVVIVLNPEFSFHGNDPVRKFTISQFEHGYVDLKAIFAELNEIEPGWGGSPTVGGSPQGISSDLTLNQVAQVVEKHILANN